MGIITTCQCDVFKTMGAKCDVRRVRVTVHVADEHDVFPESPRQSFTAYLSRRARERCDHFIAKAFLPPASRLRRASGESTDQETRDKSASGGEKGTNDGNNA